MDLTGMRCGAFEVWGPITQGGMSRVWLARHRELCTPAVIKTLLGVDDGDEAFARLRNEARLMARIPNHHVVRAMDVGTHDGTPYLVQEYVDGLDLAELDHRRRSALQRGLPLWFVCNVVNDVAGALQSAHQTGVIHRDVKPSNLFGSPQTGISLGDFGIAVARGIEEKSASGTLRFIAPEVLRGDPPGRQCDVYSLGATAYDLYYGTPPKTDLQSILDGSPVRFPRARTAEEAYFQHVLSRMLEREPADRVPSMSAPARLLGPLGRTLRPRLPGIAAGKGLIQVGSVLVNVRLGDIVDAEVDGIVNSANDEMTMQTGVGGALRRKGGQVIEDEAMRGGKRALGDCFATGAGALRCKEVLHAVSAWKEASCIARATQRAFLLAEERGLRTLAVPALGTGMARVSPESCAYAAASALHWHLHLGGSKLKEVSFVLYDRRTYEVFEDQLSGIFLGDADLPEDEVERPGDPAFAPTIHLTMTKR
ncbi:MAG: serine/threonine-protein kinase [Byssovorax sp.]